MEMLEEPLITLSAGDTYSQQADFWIVQTGLFAASCIVFAVYCS